MRFTEFCELVNDLKKKHPIWFELSSKYLPNDTDLYNIEQYYNVTLPDDYKSFLKNYGGGYFGFSQVFSFDTTDKLYIMCNNSIEFVKENKFISIADLGTGDLVGYKIQNKVCSNELYFWNHESKNLEKSHYKNFLDFILKEGLKINLNS